MYFLTQHMVDDQAMDTLLAESAFKKPMTGGNRAREDAALEVYFRVYEETQDPEKAKEAWFAFHQNQQQ